jgi:hypothetical protein
MGAMQGLIQQYDFQYRVLKDQLGEDPNLITSAVQPRVTSENVQASQQASAYATDYMYDAVANVLEQTAKKIACLLNNSVRFGSSAYRHIMNEDDVKDRQFSTKFQLLPDTFELQRMEAFMNQSLAANPPLIQYLDPMKLMRIAKENVKLAELYLRNSMKRMIRAEAEKAQQQSEQNAQVQAQAAQMKAQGDLQLQTQKLQMEKEMAEYKALQDMKVEIVRGSFVVAAKGAEAQMPSWLMPIITQLVPNITIPIGLENQQMTQGIQQQQQEMQEPVQEGSQGSPEMEQQEQMQPQ